MPQIDDRVLPHSLDAEQAVLGSMLIESRAIHIAVERLIPSDFYRDSHRWIFESIRHLDGRGTTVDLLTVEDILRDREQLDVCGGHLYMLVLMDAPATAANIEHYASIVAEKAAMRRLMDAASQIGASVYDSTRSTSEKLANAGRLITEIGLRSDHGNMRSLGDVLKRRILALSDRSEGELPHQGLTTGFGALDAILGGLEPGQLVTVAARPGLGKSEWMIQAAIAGAKQSAKPVMVFSLEMSAEELVDRIIVSESGVPASGYRSGRLAARHWERIENAIDRLIKLPLYIDDTSNISATEIVSKAKRLQADKGLSLIAVDYLQIIAYNRNGNQAQEIELLARMLKSAAKDLGVPILALAQLNRNLESRADKRPTLVDLRSSGGIEQESDVVLFLYRVDHYLPASKQELVQVQEAEVIVAKQRSGPPGCAIIGWDTLSARFVNMDGAMHSGAEDDDPLPWASEVGG